MSTITTTGEVTNLLTNSMDAETAPLPKLLLDVPLCGSLTRRGTSCRSPAERGRNRCRFHGSRAGAPKGERNGSYRHGNDTVEATALRRAAGRLLKTIGAANDD